MTSFEVFYN